MAKLVFFCFFSTAFGDIIKSPSKYFSFHWHALELTGSYDWVLSNYFLFPLSGTTSQLVLVLVLRG